LATHRLIASYTRIPVPGGKLIEEIAGRVNTGEARFSMAHMVAPAGWGEPPQRPSFGELTVLVRGRMRVELGGEGHGAPEVVEVAAGQSIWLEPGVRVRYSNPFPQEAEYYALCLPAFAPDAAGREE
jgi:mannose-6-phosphate isomerase-like protein (cupin superfamily)